MCVKLPEPPDIVLPDPLTLGTGIATPAVGVNPALCCKFAAFTIPPVTILPPIPASVALPLLASLRALKAAINALQPRCPKN